MSLLAGASYADEGGKLMNEDRYGLHVEQDGTVTLRGEPFYGFGVNYFAAFARYADSENQRTDEFKAGIAGLASYNIPFIRIPLCGYYPSYYEVYDRDPERVFSYLKEVLDECEKYHIGVIGSLLWWEAVIPAHVQGKRSDMGDPESEAVKYAKKYVEDVVSRFADHPAIWGWEIGNEYNLGADLCDSEFKQFLWPQNIDNMPLDNVNGFDYYTADEMAVFYSEIAKVIRKYDSYRMISSGNGEMRPAAYALHEQSKTKNNGHVWELRWDQNTREQFEIMNELMTPDPVDTVCFHLQQATYDGSRRYIMNFRYFGRNMSSKEYFEAYYETAKSLGKACYFGEFGDMLEMENDPGMIDKFKEITTAISESGIQIASLWQFQDYTDQGSAGLKLEVLSELNKMLAAEGKQSGEDDWQPLKPEDKVTPSPAPADKAKKGCGGSAGACGAAVAAVAACAAAAPAKRKKKNR